MIHIVICSNQERAEKYCRRKELTPYNTTIIMFTGELSPYLMIAKGKQEICTVHDLNDNYKYTVKNFETI